NLSYSVCMEGISLRQGGHQVAQKLMKTTFPFNSAVLTGLPASSLNRADTVISSLSMFLVFSCTVSCAVLSIVSLDILFVELFVQAAKQYPMAHRAISFCMVFIFFTCQIFPIVSVR